MKTFDNLKPFSITKHSHVCVKIAVSFLFIGIAFRLLLSLSPPSVLNDKTVLPLSDLSQEANVPVSSSPVQQDLSSFEIENNNDDSTTQNSQSSGAEKCDLFTGDWIPDNTGPFYDNQSCLLMEGHQNCMKNGRPDSGYLYWRWSPRGCELPRFNPQKFLDLMRNRAWAFIGDSISRNHVQSLLCILSQVEQAVEVYHDEQYRSKIWKFPSHNFTLSVIWAPFLVKAKIFEDMNGVSSSEVQLHLDKLDTDWTNEYVKYDYITIGGGKWFLKTAIYHENDTVTGCHYCPGKNLTELGFDYAYRKALQLVLNFTTQNRALVFFRTITPEHFENGEWFSGGKCNRTVPFKEGEIDMSDVDEIMRNIELEEFEKAVALGSKNGVALKLLDTTRVSLLRPDGHPGPYRTYQPFAEDKNAKVQYDCLHWCLPGPIDSWNDVVLKMLLDDL